VLTAFRNLGYAVGSHMSLKGIVLTGVEKDGYTVIPYASQNLHIDRDLWIAAVQKDGNALRYASDQVRADKKVVNATIAQTSGALRYALGGLNQDPEFLKAIGLWDIDGDRVYKRPEMAALSIKFSFAEESTTYATEFVQKLKRDLFLGTSRPTTRMPSPKSLATQPSTTWSTNARGP